MIFRKFKSSPAMRIGGALALFIVASEAPVRHPLWREYGLTGDRVC
jgi:hypothetical protein